MPMAIVVGFISAKPCGGEMCRWTVAAAHRARSSKCRLSGSHTRIGRNESPGTGAARLRQSLLAPATAAAAAGAPSVCSPFWMPHWSTFLSQRRGKGRPSEWTNGSCIPAPGPEDSPMSARACGAPQQRPTTWPLPQAPGEFDSRDLHVMLPASVLSG